MRFVRVEVWYTPPSGSPVPHLRGTVEGELVAQGVGLPVELPALPNGATRINEMGRLRGIGELPAPAGERARITVENLSRTLSPSHYSVVVTIGDGWRCFIRIRLSIRMVSAKVSP